jgi:7,8-dihydropterin-6-yl-methyl-4-(beta-D-ribofuranosyl)aminobenzene 5'-phosphate synthase
MIVIGAKSAINCAKKGQTMAALRQDGSNGDLDELSTTVVYDNEACAGGLARGWGYSAFITGPEQAVLFDTGPGPVLLENMERLEIDPEAIGPVVLSHVHPDHCGGLCSLLEVNPQVTVYVPQPPAREQMECARSSGTMVVEITEPCDICPGVYSTGPLGMWTKEQALIVRTPAGMIIAVGCAHPGIVKIVEKAKTVFGGDIALVMGGFHVESSGGNIEKVIAAFDRLGVNHVMPGHCCGERAKEMLEDHFGGSYMTGGAGARITLADLQ